MKTMKGPATAPMSHPVVEPVTPAAIDGTTTRQRAMTAILWDPRRSVSIPSLSICDKYCSLCCTTRFHCSFITLIIFFVCYSPPPSIIISHYWLHNWWMNLTSVRYADYVSAVGFQSEYWGGGWRRRLWGSRHLPLNLCGLIPALLLRVSLIRW